jgi:hypothetical protein
LARDKSIGSNSMPFTGNHRRSNSWKTFCQAFVYASGVLWLSGLIPKWGQWYLENVNHRAQIHALLSGSLALSDSPSALRNDLAWSEGGVHQVWGLGVPLWHLPFVAAAKLFGIPDFPDSLVLGVALMLAACAALRAFGVGWGSEAVPWGTCAGAGAVLLTLVFPPFLGLLRSQFQIYEEVIAYEYIFAVTVLCSLVALVRAPSLKRYWLLCIVSGFGGLIRPTLVFYGVASLIAGAGALWLARRTTKQPSDIGSGARSTDSNDNRDFGTLPWSRRLEAFTPKGALLIGGLLFSIGGGVLFVTNLERFGSGSEFGHRLNVQDLYGSLYATRFDHPYQHEKVLSAARELFGFMFLAKDFNGANYYQAKIFPMQSPTVRWRHLYLTTYNLRYVALLLGGVGFGFLAFWPSARAGVCYLRSYPRLRCDLESQVSGVLLLWSLISLFPLSLFYMYAPVLSSRYMLDFMPAFVAIMVAGWFGFCLLLAEKRFYRFLAPIFFILLVSWVVQEISRTDSLYGGPDPLHYWNLPQQNRSMTRAKMIPTLPNEYDLTTRFSELGIPFNGTGWSMSTGAVMPCTIFFISDPEFLELDLKGSSENLKESDLRDLRAKVGLEFLDRSFARKTDTGWTVRFYGPKKKRYQKGIQSAFVVFVPNRDLAAPCTPWRLLKLRWRQDPSGNLPADKLQAHPSTL